VLVLGSPGSAVATATSAPRLLDLRVGDGSRPFAGDRTLLTTVSPNGDGFRDRAVVRFRASAPATVELDALATDTADAGVLSRRVVFRTRARVRAGPGSLVWSPARTTPPRTYLLRLTVTDARGRRRVYGAYGPGAPQDAPVVRVQGVDAGFTRRSYAPGENADVEIACDARSLHLQVFAYSRGAFPTSPRDALTSGIAMTGSVAVDWRAHRDAPALLRFVRTGDWPSGLYFLRISTDDGRVGYAPFIVRPPRLGVHRIAVVLATNTWQAYNFEDANGDGWGDSWYVGGTNTVDLERPFLDFGVPFRFHDWDLAFIAWLNATGRQVDFLSDDDLDDAASGDRLAKAYDLMVFPGHEEYVTQHEYDVVQRYRDLGGNLLFLAANNFFWEVQRDGTTLRRVKLWRDVGRPEAALVGVQYAGSNHGENQAGFVVRDASSWAFAGTGLSDGASFGRYGIEIDARAEASPPGIDVLASIPNAVGPGRNAEMTYYETPAGAKVFAAGALNFAASIGDPVVARILDNVWARLSSP
jgi:hypothetical protein